MHLLINMGHWSIGGCPLSLITWEIWRSWTILINSSITIPPTGRSTMFLACCKTNWLEPSSIVFTTSILCGFLSFKARAVKEVYSAHYYHLSKPLYTLFIISYSNMRLHLSLIGGLGSSILASTALRNNKSLLKSRISLSSVEGCLNLNSQILEELQYHSLPSQWRVPFHLVFLSHFQGVVETYSLRNPLLNSSQLQLSTCISRISMWMLNVTSLSKLLNQVEDSTLT